MARRHFRSNLKPDVPAIVEDMKQCLVARGIELKEVFVAGSYGRQLREAFAATGQTDINLLVDAIEKTKGDVDILVHCRRDDLDLAVAKDWLDVHLNGIEWAAGARTKDFSIDLWLTDRAILLRTSPVIQVYPKYVFDCTPPGDNLG